MKRFVLRTFPILALLIAQHSLASEDSLSVVEVKGNIAVAEGKAQDIKPNDFVYTAKSPYRFKVLSVDGNKITLNLSKPNDLALGEKVSKTATPQILKNVEAESRLKKALED